jgi:hypothetical protein
MTMPGFEAEASLFIGSHWRTVGSEYDVEASQTKVQPALLRCRDCVDICEGDFIGACMPWCLCRCHGGKHCGVPS